MFFQLPQSMKQNMRTRHLQDIMKTAKELANAVSIVEDLLQHRISELCSQGKFRTVQ
jgi:hypothetical protein